MIIIATVSTFLVIHYFILVILIIFGWKKIKPFSPDSKTPAVKISVLIPFRNEEENLSQLLQDLSLQNYPDELLQFVLIDDHSTDKSKEIVLEYMNRNPKIQLLSCSDEEHGKKAALRLGYKNVIGNLIVTTDADCRLNSNWLRTMALHYEEYNSQMIIGPVVFDEEKSVFQKMQSLEFLSLIGSTAGLSGINRPIMCNGANLAYKKEIINGNIDFLNPSLASGDDVFLLHHLKEHNKNNIHFLKSKDAVVVTNAQSSLRAFISQRLRWASKSKGYKDSDSLIIALLIFITNTTLAILLMLSIVDLHYLFLFAALFLVKSFIDFIFLNQICTFFEKRKLLKWFIPVQLIYIFYVPIIGFLSLFIRSGWKGRT